MVGRFCLFGKFQLVLMGTKTRGIALLIGTVHTNSSTGWDPKKLVELFKMLPGTPKLVVLLSMMCKSNVDVDPVAISIP